MLVNYIFKLNSIKLSKRNPVGGLKKFITVYTVLTILILNLVIYKSNSFSQSVEDKLILNDLINIAMENNPQLQSLYSAIQADSAKIPQAGALPDPILSLNLLNLPTNSFAFDQEPMTGKQIALKQLFPFPGKLRLKEDISSEGATISAANFQEYKNQIIKDLKVGYYDLFLIIDLSR